MPETLRLVMMGTGPFAVPTFRALHDTRHEVAALVTQPPRPVQGKRPAPQNPMRRVAEEQGTLVLDPENINTAEAREELELLQPDLFAVADYGQILRGETLAVARLGGINLHGSLLPKYRGAAPINWAIYHGETETGVTVIRMTERVDAGPPLAQAATRIGPEETAIELEARLAQLGAPLVCEMIDALAAGRAAPLPAEAAEASRAPRLKKSDGQVDWQRPAAALVNQVRALEPWPKTYTWWHRVGEEMLRLILCKVSATEAEHREQPGTVLRAEGNELLVATGGGQALAIHALQPAGKRVLSTAEFLRGYPITRGHRLGPAESPSMPKV